MKMTSMYQLKKKLYFSLSHTRWKIQRILQIDPYEATTQ